LDVQPELYALADGVSESSRSHPWHVPEPPVIKGADSSGTITLLVDIAIDGSVERVQCRGHDSSAYRRVVPQAATTWLYRPAILNTPSGEIPARR